MEKLREKIHPRIVTGDANKDIASMFGVSLSTVYKVKTIYGASGDFSDRPKTGRPRSSRTKAVISAVKPLIEENPQSNVRKIARDLNVDKSSVSRIMRKDLGMKSRAVTKVQGLTALQREKRRFKRCKILLNKMKRGDDRVLIFSDEKITIDAVSNSRSFSYIAKRPEDVTGVTKHPAGAMILGIIDSDGKVFPPFGPLGPSRRTSTSPSCPERSSQC
jgi:transposase